MTKIDAYFDQQISAQIYLQMKLPRKLLVKIGFQKKWGTFESSDTSTGYPTKLYRNKKRTAKNISK